MIPAITPLSATASSSHLSAVTPAGSSSGDGFANLLGSALDALDSTTANATNLALEGATGQANIADVTVAATEAQLVVQLASSLRNEGVTAINSIMSMQAG